MNDFGTIAGDLPTSVNGMLNPVLAVAPGSVERWRFIHGGVTNEMSLSVYPATGDTCAAWADDPIDLHQYATDGITYPAIDTRGSVFLATGNRGDVLFEARPSSLCHSRRDRLRGLFGRQFGRG